MIRTLTLGLVLQWLIGATAALSQTAADESSMPPAAAVTPQARPVLPPVVPQAQTTLPPPVSTVPSSPTAPTAAAQQHAIADMATEQVAPAARIAELRATFEDLKRRDAELQALRSDASAETLTEVQRLKEAIAAVEADLSILTWKSENLRILAQGLATSPAGALPAGVPAGTTPDIALAVVEGQTTLYAKPQTEAAEVIRTLDTITTMLRVAELGAFTLVWSPKDQFVFVLSQFREVY